MGEWSQNSTDRASQVWKNLADSFGPRFLRDYGNQAPPVWANAIRNLNDHEIAKGFRRLLMHGSASSPTLPQFVKACRMGGDIDGESRPAVTALPDNRFFDEFKLIANQEILKFLVAKGGVDMRLLPALIEAKNLVAKQYLDISTVDKVGESEVREQVKKALAKVWQDAQPVAA